MKNLCKKLCVPFFFKVVYANSSNVSKKVDDTTEIIESNNTSKKKQMFERYSGVPLLPKEASQYQPDDNVLKQAVTFGAVNNPAVMLGLVLTTAALLKMFQKTYTGDRLGAQKFMRYRIIAQFFTLFALIAGIIYFVIKMDKKQLKSKIE